MRLEFAGDDEAAAEEYGGGMAGREARVRLDRGRLLKIGDKLARAQERTAVEELLGAAAVANQPGAMA